MKSNTHICLYTLIFAFTLIGFTIGCSKEPSNETNPIAQIPELITTDVSYITINSAVSGGNCSDGGAPVTIKGVCWSTSHNPTIDSPKSNDSSGTGFYFSKITDLLPNTTYYVRAYATNRIGTGYGNEVTFSTLAIATVSVDPITKITPFTAMTTLNVTSKGDSALKSVGVCWSINPHPTKDDSKAYYVEDFNTLDIGTYKMFLSNLTKNTKYYVRGFASSSLGIGYGNEIEFTTTSSQYELGQSYEGGIIFYVDATGQHGLIAAPSDLPTRVVWGCSGTLIDGTYGSIGSGQANTTAIINKCSDANIAARLCADLDLGGYNDWYLPSAYELGYLNLHKSHISGFDIGGMDHYWTSTEAAPDPNLVCIVDLMYSAFIDGFITNGKQSLCNVRPIRSF